MSIYTRLPPNYKAITADDVQEVWREKDREKLSEYLANRFSQDIAFFERESRRTNTIMGNEAAIELLAHNFGLEKRSSQNIWTSSCNNIEKIMAQKGAKKYVHFWVSQARPSDTCPIEDLGIHSVNIAEQDSNAVSLAFAHSRAAWQVAYSRLASEAEIMEFSSEPPSVHKLILNDTHSGTGWRYIMPTSEASGRADLEGPINTEISAVNTYHQ